MQSIIALWAKLVAILSQLMALMRWSNNKGDDADNDNNNI